MLMCRGITIKSGRQCRSLRAQREACEAFIDSQRHEGWICVPKTWERHGLKPWLEAAKKRLHHNVLAIALANKLARIAWSVLANHRNFQASNIGAAAQ